MIFYESIREYTMIVTDEKFYQVLLDNLNDGVYFVDRDRRITYWSKGAERITGYQKAEVVGRCCADNLLTHVDEKGSSLCLGGCPLSFAMNDGIARNGEIFLHHRDGHRVPVTVRAFPLRNAQGEVEGAVEIFNDNTNQTLMLERIAQFEKMAYLDTLTGVANRRFTEMTLHSRLDERHRYGWAFGILFIDVDHFKNVNDQYGHDVGDQVLAMVAKTLSNSVRSFDFVGRWGGEEFLAILANVDAAELHTFADRIRALVEQSHLAVGTGGQQVRVTVSIGGTITRSDDSLAALIKRADEFMYASKRAGRNCVTMGE